MNNLNNILTIPIIVISLFGCSNTAKNITEKPSTSSPISVEAKTSEQNNSGVEKQVDNQDKTKVGNQNTEILLTEIKKLKNIASAGKFDETKKGLKKFRDSWEKVEEEIRDESIYSYREIEEYMDGAIANLKTSKPNKEKLLVQLQSLEKQIVALDEFYTTPDKLKVPDGHTMFLKIPAKGIQIYTCQNKANVANQYEWKLKAPQAELLNDEGKNNFGKHYAGPTWEAKDGSKVVGKVKAMSVAQSANSIPWLLLNIKSRSGNGVLNKAIYIQRVDTVGGKAPKDGCDLPHVNSELRVNYTATYNFYKAIDKK
jgi:Protein of unknown function (DUF3455)